MKMWKVVLPVAAALLLAGQALAQTDKEDRLREAEAREVEMERKMIEAERQMAEAARQIAEITRERLPRMAEIERRFELSDKPRLGVTIDSDSGTGPVEGVSILGVSPGSAASDAGLRPGDIVTAVNDESLSAESCEVANMRLLDFMRGVEEGDVLKVEYMRDGKVGSVEVEPRVVESQFYAWAGPDGGYEFHVPKMHVSPESVGKFKMGFAFPWAGSAWGELELVELNAGLGRYFGTDTGLLVVNAPESDAFELQEGDVIQSIDGREPKDARHAMRILSSYQAGEELKLGIMRDKKKRTLDIEIPADYRGMRLEEKLKVSPVVAPLPPVAPVSERT